MEQFEQNHRVDQGIPAEAMGEMADYNLATVLDGLREPGERQYSDPEIAEHKRRMDRFNEVREEFLARVRTDARQALESELGLPEHWKYGNKRKNLEEWHRKRALLAKADAAPRCEHIFENGIQCGSPRMKTGRLCYAHERMAQVRPRKLNLAPMEDANSIMLNIMEITRALADDEITEKRARILLYSQQLGLQALRNLTFQQAKREEMVREFFGSGDREERVAADERRKTQIGAKELAANDAKTAKYEGEELTAEYSDGTEKEQQDEAGPANAGMDELKPLDRGMSGMKQSGVKDGAFRAGADSFESTSSIQSISSNSSIHRVG